MVPAGQEVGGAMKGAWQCHSLKGLLIMTTTPAALDRWAVVSDADETGDLSCVVGLDLRSCQNSGSVPVVQL